MYETSYSDLSKEELFSIQSLVPFKLALEAILGSFYMGLLVEHCGKGCNVDVGLILQRLV